MKEHSSGKNMLAESHAQHLWSYATVVLLGLWMIAAPLTFDFGSYVARPGGGRSVWLSDTARVQAVFWSDLVSGLLLVIFGIRGLRPNRPYSLWACCFVGIWLIVAPFLFWAPTAAAYINDSIVGMLVIALTVLIPGMPNMMAIMQEGPTTPPGWSYNPSSWPQRGIMIALAFAGLLVSRYLAAYQLGYIGRAWDPFFGESTERVLNSEMSHMWPISDAALGAFAYTFEFLMGWMGSPARWRTMPWMVTFFGILVIPLGLVHIFLVISQPVAVGYWCTLCIAAALIMLPMIPLQADEVVAMGQFLRAARKRGHSLWDAFWFGGTMEGGGQDERTPSLVKAPSGSLLRSSLWGMSFPWNLNVSAALGLWLMFAPTVLGSTGTAANVERVAGALIFTFAVIAMGEVLRLVRLINLVIGFSIVVAPLFVDGGTTASSLNDVTVGILAIVLAFRGGRIFEHYGRWDLLARLGSDQT